MSGQQQQPIQAHTLGTPNGMKVGIALEELGLPYVNHRIDISKGDQFKPEFLAINPNNKIPAIVDPNGPNGEQFSLFESGAILQYLAEKTGKLIPTDPAARMKVIQWVYWQMAGVGPMFGQFGHFYYYAKEKIPYAINRYRDETRRLLSVLEKQLGNHAYLAGEEYTIADIATAPWVFGLDLHYKAKEELKLDEFPNVKAWLLRIMARPAVIRAYESFGYSLKDTAAWGNPNSV